MDLTTSQMYALAYFGSMIELIIFLAILLGFVILVINIYNNLIEAIFGKEDIKEYD